MSNPTIFTVPLGFLGAYLGTVLSKSKIDESTFAEVLFKANTGHGISSSQNH
jgi:cation/acetate symporter